MPENLPYVTTVGTLERLLEKIKTASVPDRFTQDFLATKLAMKGGTANSMIPFLKKMGFLGSDGTPTALYREFRNPGKSGVSIAKAFRKLYHPLYELNEYIHDESEGEIKGAVVQCTGGSGESSVVKQTLTTINALRKLADFENKGEEVSEKESDTMPQREYPETQMMLQQVAQTTSHQKRFNLSYTINLNLPATKDIEVFNAIFKSLKEYLLKD